jgi:sugar O-acyltransferase (sialic acid O-acetyltransferase NeuD family)
LRDSKLLPLLILGAGGHAKVLLEVINKENLQVIGIVSPHLKRGVNYLGLPVIGNDENIFEFDSKEVLLVNGIGVLPKNHLRSNLALKMRKMGYQFSSIIHPNSIISSDVSLSDGVQIMAGVIIQPSCKIGQDTIVNTGSQIDHDTIIGSQCHIAPGVVISGGVKIGDNVHIGSGAKVIQGITIGKDSVIAAGTTVYKDVPDGVKVRQHMKIIMEIYKD